MIFVDVLWGSRAATGLGAFSSAAEVSSTMELAISPLGRAGEAVDEGRAGSQAVAANKEETKPDSDECQTP